MQKVVSGMLVFLGLSMAMAQERTQRSFDSVQRSLENLKSDLAAIAQKEKLPMLDDKIYEALQRKYALPPLKETRYWLRCYGENLAWLFDQVPPQVATLIKKGFIVSKDWWELPVSTRNYLSVDPFDMEFESEGGKKIAYFKIDPIKIYFQREIHEHEYGVGLNEMAFKTKNSGKAVLDMIDALFVNQPKESYTAAQRWVHKIWQHPLLKNKYRFVVSNLTNVPTLEQYRSSFDPVILLVFNKPKVSNESSTGGHRKVISPVVHETHIDAWLNIVNSGQLSPEFLKLRRKFIQEILFYTTQFKNPNLTATVEKELRRLYNHKQMNVLHPYFYGKLSGLTSKSFNESLRLQSMQLSHSSSRWKVDQFIEVHALFNQVYQDFAVRYGFAPVKHQAIDREKLESTWVLDVRKNLKNAGSSEQEISFILGQRWFSAFDALYRKLGHVNWIPLPIGLERFPEVYQRLFRWKVYNAVINDEDYFESYVQTLKKINTGELFLEKYKNEQLSPLRPSEFETLKDNHGGVVFKSVGGSEVPYLSEKVLPMNQPSVPFYVKQQAHLNDGPVTAVMDRVKQWVNKQKILGIVPRGFIPQKKINNMGQTEKGFYWSNEKDLLENLVSIPKDIPTTELRYLYLKLRKINFNHFIHGRFGELINGKAAYQNANREGTGRWGLISADQVESLLKKHHLSWEKISGVYSFLTVDKQKNWMLDDELFKIFKSIEGAVPHDEVNPFQVGKNNRTKFSARPKKIPRYKR